MSIFVDNKVFALEKQMQDVLRRLEELEKPIEPEEPEIDKRTKEYRLWKSASSQR